MAWFFFASLYKFMEIKSWLKNIVECWKIGVAILVAEL